MASVRTISNGCDHLSCKHVAVLEVYRGDGSYYGKYCQNHGESTASMLSDQENIQRIRDRHRPSDELVSDLSTSSEIG